MRLVSFRRYRRRALGALVLDDQIVDLEAAAAACLSIEDGDPSAEAEAALRLPASVTRFLAGGDASRLLAERALAFAATRGERGGIDGEPLLVPSDSVVLETARDAPLVFSTGATFRDRVATEGGERPKHTEFYLRNPYRFLGPGDDIPLQPWVTQELDAAPCVAVVIGRRAHRVTEAEGLEAVYGYCLVNDLTARDLHVLSWAGPLFHMQYAQGKAFDGSLVLGPAVVSKEEAGDLSQATARLWVNERLVREGPAVRVSGDPARWVAYLSEFVTLMPGMLIVLSASDSTVVGSDPASGDKLSVHQPEPSAGRWLDAGARVAVEIDGLGRLENRVQRVEPSDFSGVG